MKIVILSGGSGNDTLVKGLNKFAQVVNCDCDKKLDNVENLATEQSGFNLDINVIVNAYDNGKSTGVCRALTKTLGVSDIRKNHARMYEAIYGDKADKNVLAFYGNRYNFSSNGGSVEEQVCELLTEWKMTEYIEYAHRFFENEDCKNYKFDDFSVSNIIYAQMYKEIGYEKTNKHFCDKIGIKDFVVLNSFDNLFIKALTQSGHIIEDEGETVFWNNKDDKIVRTIYDVKTHFGLNQRAIDLVQSADLIIISTGTFWSSIQPTIEYLDFYKYINSAKAKKIWVMNNEEDGDSFGVNSLDFLRLMEESGLDLSAFTILLNQDARESLRLTDDKHHFVVKSMGNNKGKHDRTKYARAILEVYYNLENKDNYDKILFDFDDTIWSRDKTEKDEKTSIENVKLINDNFKNAIIVSGNSFESIQEKISKIYGDNLGDFLIPLWADANSTRFEGGKVTDFIDDFVIDEKSRQVIEEIIKEFDLKYSIVGQKPVNYKIKPLSKLERKLLVKLINLQYPKMFRADIAGRTTVDILALNNNKSKVFIREKLENKKTLFIGDELQNGNDVDIAKLCNETIEVKNVFETNLILKVLIG